MTRRRDPVERAADDSVDLYDVSTWEPRSTLDHLAYSVYAALNYGLRGVVLAAAFMFTLALLASPAVLVADEPAISVFFLLSIVPALLLAAYIWRADITTREPLGLLVATFALAVLFATFAAVINTIGAGVFYPIPVVGAALFFYLIVGPVEEIVKLLAVRVFAYRSESFDAVIVGTVYGAVAGLGFAAIENVIYITQVVAEVGPEAGLYTAATEIATVRALVGPGHVIYSAIAGYYLGLAKFNRQYAGPLIAKGLLVAAFVHATYNITVGFIPGFVAGLYPVTADAVFVTYVVGYNVAIGYYLYRKIAHYRRTYRDVSAGDTGEPRSELTEFDPSRR
ncbi:PrsW family intramembrane metalloprotease [Natrialbaceae archaeon AArc-T1-2]|uniref:PrsW family intramembrane metalloprotease n=1 Tax=Natrialbaceae archaeon AArc-T1-2 TaxID=3053904 RepID=UPI00255B14A1|nr:PrsW family intramembrane metalloprotease [Natrialbaceae archaeon AArc-T1-2]WIV68060.1 PrsW family intramembrane metalloprotease [Natrialbaceae archaeon AArc-T1-2]